LAPNNGWQRQPPIQYHLPMQTCKIRCSNFS
jgi:hypothetical protein